ncbi:hypothetical protein AAFF_G00343380 [Aldrovandia affinis]|uniref:Uncharacterized protein n=1 Tax=Aldrovandia affinis TaxID=143900 RepID=A0AAD7SK38_9TELE|nr:hypothetical protein AAFF_G00343380 [Aldrovandia affinis]
MAHQLLRLKGVTSTLRDGGAIAPPSSGGHQRGTPQAVDTASHVHPALGQQVDANVQQCAPVGGASDGGRRCGAAQAVRVPAYTKGTEEACGTIIAQLTCKLLQEWRCADQVVNMAFDTTASNTGHLMAACIAIQLSLGRPLLWSGCWHHIGEGTITTRQQVLKILAFADFITHIYATWWLTCDTAIDAAWNDLTLHHHLYAYKSVDAGIAASVIKELERHLWYLTGEMLPLVLFSTKVPVGERHALTEAILEYKPADLPMRAPQLCFGTGFRKPKFPALSLTTSLANLAVRHAPAVSHFVTAVRSEQNLQFVLQAVEHDRSKQPNLRCCKRKLDTDQE